MVTEIIPLGCVNTEQKRKFSLIFAASQCERQLELSKNPFECDVDFAFAFAQRK